MTTSNPQDLKVERFSVPADSHGFLTDAVRLWLVMNDVRIVRIDFAMDARDHSLTLEYTTRPDAQPHDVDLTKLKDRA